MASTAATVFFLRPARMSRRAELTGSFVGAGVVCAATEAASNSKAGITRVVFILSSSFFGESGGLPQPQFPGHQPSGFTTIRTRVNTRFHALLLLLHVLSATASSQRISHECGNSSTPRRTGPSRTDCSRLPGDSWKRIEPQPSARVALMGAGDGVLMWVES